MALAALCCTGCGESPKTTADGYRELNWLDMVPAADIEAIKHPPPVDHAGSMRAQQTGTYDTIPALDGQKVRLAGYLVPLEADDKGNLTEFFLVPYQGACIHVPPPPPNQIVYVKLDHGIEPPEILDAYAVKGVLRTRRTANDLAGSAYALEQASVAPWEG
ncbi:MAG TPA: DUF3299 domain-containing protein [Rudaea sp.]|nr:DUF3299 domain-containing protein [Rudaea sp.]